MPDKIANTNMLNIAAKRSSAFPPHNDDTLSIKFDDGPIREWSCAEADGGSSGIVFINNAGAFLAQLKKAKKVIIEAQMYEAGRQQMTFEVTGLKWE